MLNNSFQINVLSIVITLISCFRFQSLHFPFKNLNSNFLSKLILYSNKIIISIFKSNYWPIGFYLILYPRSSSFGYLSFQPDSNFNSKIKHNKGNLQCDDRDSVKVSKQAITTINNNSINKSNNPEIIVLIRIVICAN